MITDEDLLRRLSFCQDHGFVLKEKWTFYMNWTGFYSDLWASIPVGGLHDGESRSGVGRGEGDVSRVEEAQERLEGRRVHLHQW